MEVNTSEVYDICDLIHSYEQLGAQVQLAFESFISDKDIPLSDRWAIWVNAPDSLKCSEGWLYHWFSTEIDDGVCYDGRIWHAERYSVVHIANVIERIEEMSKDELDFLCIDQEMIDNEKELILKRNIGSYQYDW